MKTSITEFNNQTERIKTHLEVLDKFNQLIRTQNNADVDFIKANSTHEKEFTYRSNIISLYGAFEHFVESVIIEYIQSVQEHIASFEEWGEKITRNYFELWKCGIFRAVCICRDGGHSPSLPLQERNE